MPSLKIACPECGNLMGVVEELLGRKVRCPTCQSISLAPAALDNAGGEPPQFAAPAVPTGTAGEVPTPAAPSSVSHAAAPPVEQVASDGQSSRWLLAFVVPYAVCMTFLAAYFYYQFRSAQQQHPLEQIPDLFGEFKNTTRKGATQVLRLPPPETELPTRLIARLGQSVRLGDQLEVTPLKLEQRSLVSHSKERGKDEAETVIHKRETLVLTVRLRNVSHDVTFHPTDPFFDRRPKTPSDKPYTFVEVGGRKYFGGVISYPYENKRLERVWLTGQEADHLPLRPGESRETVLATHPADGVADAVAQQAGDVTWRVHLRRGLTIFKNREVPVTGVIGVRFTVGEIQRGGSS